MDNEQKISFLHIVYISLKFDYLNNFEQLKKQK